MTDKPLSRNIARNVAVLRQERGLSLVELARRMTEQGQPITRMGLTRLELCQRRVDADEWHTLANVLGVPPGRLLAHAPACNRCSDAPPAGYACLACRRKGVVR